MAQSLLDARVTELLCARLCHDLISPVGAVNTGLELLDEIGEDAEAMELVRTSAAAAGNKLRFFRIAYGLAGGGLAGVSLSEGAAAATAVETQRIRLDWTEEHRPGAPAPAAGSVKLLLNMVLLASECLPRGGSLAVRVRQGDGGLRAEVEARPETGAARLSDEAKAAFEGDLEVASLTPRTIQAYYTRFVAMQLRIKLSIDTNTEGGLMLSATLPADF